MGINWYKNEELKDFDKPILYWSRNNNCGVFRSTKINHIGIGCVKNIPLFVGDLLIVLNRIFNYIRFEFFLKNFYIYIVFNLFEL